MKTFILIFFGTIAGVWSGPLGVTFGRDQCVLRGESVVIDCKYDYPLAHIVTGVSWAKSQQRSGNGELVPLLTSQNSGRFRYVGNYRGNCNLQISDVQLADEGSYVFGFRTTLAWLTTSTTPAQLFVRELTAVGPSSVVEGDAVSLACVSGCGPPVESVWFRQGEPVMKAAFQARRTDAGWYHCAVRGQPTVRSAPVALTVLYPPDRVSLSISPGGNVLRGASVVFTCSGEANPPVEDRGFSLHRDGRLLGFGRSQTIPDVQPDHSGRYRCQAWNSISRAGADTFTSAVVLLQVYCTHVDMNSTPLMQLVTMTMTVMMMACVESLCSPRPPRERFGLGGAGQPRGRQQCEPELLRCRQPSGRKLHLVQDDGGRRLRGAGGGLGTGAAHPLHGGLPLWTVPLPGQEPSSLTLPVLAGLGLRSHGSLCVGSLCVLVRGTKSGWRRKRRLSSSSVGRRPMTNPPASTPTSTGRPLLRPTSLSTRRSHDASNSILDRRWKAR
ncbi:unnamed protein product [Tetraodon nigroviridis]|uniref:Chromosome 8 SCAF15119, whole genome shotgun sequence n=1 Tax=Tetraodon nigroviridis TaxID=99883 RepID=Q4RFF7_TETNG|nr:unnamed protein product [Tetraodon nigroviridis]